MIEWPSADAVTHDARSHEPAAPLVLLARWSASQLVLTDPRSGARRDRPAVSNAPAPTIAIAIPTATQMALEICTGGSSLSRTALATAVRVAVSRRLERRSMYHGADFGQMNSGQSVCELAS
jgi:hypothetical protein